MGRPRAPRFREVGGDPRAELEVPPHAGHGRDPARTHVLLVPPRADAGHEKPAGLEGARDGAEVGVVAVLQVVPDEGVEDDIHARGGKVVLQVLRRARDERRPAREPHPGRAPAGDPDRPPVHV